MNVHDPKSTVVDAPSKTEAKDALKVLQDWAKAEGRDLSDMDLTVALRRLSGANTLELSTEYPEDFTSNKAYIATLPDLQNGPSSLIQGADKMIGHVGISNFKLPIQYRSRDERDLTLETSVTGSVSLEAGKKGINMSRIMRSFYKHAEKEFSVHVMEAAVGDYKSDLGSFDARIQMRFSYPMKKQSLRSGLEGYQYYDIALEAVDVDGKHTQIMHLDYVYSSTCPCSLELAEHARRMRGQLATPHSQRSVARISVEILPGERLWYEDLIDLCSNAVKTETQVMVKREDEQAFAELNAANPIFVEDAARLFCEALDAEPRIGDFRVVASHQESLHSHDAISVLTQGDLFAQTSFDPRLFDTLFHVG